MKKGKLNLLILLILLGLGISIYLTVQHFQVLTKGLLAPSFCNFSERFDCDSVMMSDYGKLGPFPLGGLSLVYFLYLLFPALYARLSPDAVRSTLALPFLITLPSVAFSIYLAYVSTFILKTYCIFCVSLYLIIFFIFLLLRGLMEVPFFQIGSFMANYSKALFGKVSDRLSFKPQFFGNFIYALALFSITLFILYSQEKKYAADFEDFDRTAYLNFFYLQKPIPIDPKGRPMWGREGAPITIMEFSDFECPFCKVAALNLKPRLKAYQDNIAFYFLNYPLDKSCNPTLPQNMHEQACDTAKAALCAREQGKFWPFHDLLFAQQPKFSHDQLLGYAKKVGLDVGKFEWCMGSDEIKQKLAADIEAGKAANLEGTPMVLINGRLMKEWMNPVMLDLVVKEEIKRAKQPREASSPSLPKPIPQTSSSNPP